MSRVELRNIKKHFGTNCALDGLDVEIKPGEIVGLTGPSGAGKTTTCRIIAGMEHPSEGEVRFNGSEVNSLSTQNRGVAFMFESFALYPQFNVSDNIAFPLKAPKQKGRYTAEEIGKRVREMTQFVEIENLESRFPSELSGGQKQRVALCRALIQEPTIYLLDEPLSHLDAKLYHRLQGEIRRRLIKTEIPTLWISPNALEVLSVSDRVIVLANGQVQHIGPPEEIFRRPANMKVAQLVGDPPVNLIKGRIGQEGEGGKLVFEHPAFKLPLRESLQAQIEASDRREEMILGIRPTEIQLVDEHIEHKGHEGQVYVYEPFGKYVIMSVRIGEDIIKVKNSKLRPYQQGEAVRLDFSECELLAFDSATGQVI